MPILIGSFTHFVPSDVRGALSCEPSGFGSSDPAFLEGSCFLLQIPRLLIYFDRIPFLEIVKMRRLDHLLKKLRLLSGQRSFQMNDHEAICRICFDVDTETGRGLISPCMCKGTQQFIHRSCLDEWRTHGDPFALYCPTCKARYHLRAKFTKSYPWYWMKYYIIVAGDAIFSFLVLLTMVSILGLLAALVDRTQMFNIYPALYSCCLGLFLLVMMSGIYLLIGLCMMIEEHPFFRDAMHYFFYGYDFVIWFPALREVFFVTIVSIVAFFGIAFLIILILMSAEMIRIKMINHDIFLADLVKAMREYVVVDLFGHYTPPRADDDEELVPELTQGRMRM